MKYEFTNFRIGSVVTNADGKVIAILTKQEPAYGKVPEGMYFIEFSDWVPVAVRAEVEVMAHQKGAVPGCKVLFNKKENERMLTAK